MTVIFILIGCFLSTDKHKIFDIMLIEHFSSSFSIKMTSHSSTETEVHSPVPVMVNVPTSSPNNVTRDNQEIPLEAPVVAQVAAVKTCQDQGNPSMVAGNLLSMS